MSSEKDDISIRGAIFAVFIASILASGISSILVFLEYKSIELTVVIMLFLPIMISILILGNQKAIFCSIEAISKRTKNMTAAEYKYNAIKMEIGVICLTLSGCLGFIYFESLFVVFSVISVISISLISEAHHAEIIAKKKMEIMDWVGLAVFFALTLLSLWLRVPENMLDELSAFTVYQSLVISAGFTGCYLLFFINNYLKKIYLPSEE